MRPQPADLLPDASFALTSGFVLLSLVLAAAFVVALHRSALRTRMAPARARRYAVIGALAAVAWLGLTFVVAARGMLHFATPPTMPVLLAAMLVLAVALAWSPVGTRLAMGTPVALLVGFQAFRVPVELLLHRAFVEGLAPEQLTYAGRNFDIVTGLTAVVVSVWLLRGRPPRWVVPAWNAMGLALLANVVIVALLSAPVPFRVFMNEPANVWVTRAPWVWLPTVMVLAALVGHLLLFRQASARAAPNDAPARHAG